MSENKKKHFWKDIIDQQVDRSQTELYKFAEVYPSTLKKYIKTITSVSFGSMEKTASSDLFAWEDLRMFPVNSMENAIVSKVYLDSQRDKFPPDIFTKIASRLDSFLDLYSVPDGLFVRPKTFTKVAKEVIKERYLLPERGLCKIASSQDLDVANQIFSKDYNKLPIPDRVEFARNFIKTAGEFSYRGVFSDVITKYASLLDNDIENTKRLLELRTSAANRIGQSGNEYTKLADSLNEVSDTEVSKEDLTKLAEAIYEVDKKYGFDSKKYDKRMPCAFTVVFNKVAEDTQTDPLANLKSMTKADIIGKYGDGILEEIETDTGDIDYTKFASILKNLGAKV